MPVRNHKPHCKGKELNQIHHAENGKNRREGKLCVIHQQASQGVSHSVLWERAERE